MKVIKLDAIDSTNDFLKRLLKESELENYTVVTAESQNKGKGQMGSSWFSERGKNLIMSVLVGDFLPRTNHFFDLNIAFSLAVIKSLEAINIPELSIKWPNDIMSYDKKIGGILIENIFKNDGCIPSIIGLGLNVNQKSFDSLPKASSLAIICGCDFDKNVLLVSIINLMKQNLEHWHQNADAMWFEYTNRLFKKGIPMAFTNGNNQNFMGIIQGVSSTGKLKVILEDDTVSEFEIKEIQMLF